MDWVKLFMSMNGKTLYDSGVIPKWVRYRDMTLEEKLSELFYGFIQIIILIIGIPLFILILLNFRKAPMHASITLAFMTFTIITFTGYTLIFHRMRIYKQVKITVNGLIVDRYTHIGKRGKKEVIPLRNIVYVCTNIKDKNPYVVIYLKNNRLKIICLLTEYIPNAEEFISALKRVLHDGVHYTSSCYYRILKREVKRCNGDIEKLINNIERMEFD